MIIIEIIYIMQLYFSRHIGSAEIDISKKSEINLIQNQKFYIDQKLIIVLYLDHCGIFGGGVFMHFDISRLYFSAYRMILINDRYCLIYMPPTVAYPRGFFIIHFKFEFPFFHSH
jgi:hypothetical protein